MRKVLLLSFIAVFAFAGLALAKPAAATDIEPILVLDNPSCADYDLEGVKFEDQNAGGTYVLPVGTITWTRDGYYVDWESTFGIDMVIFKGGPNANVYVYDPEAFMDTGLVTPTNPSNGKPYGFSHIEFCYDYELMVTKTAVPTFTRTYQWTIDKMVDPAVWWMFAGDNATSLYEVKVDKTGYVDSGWAVSGEIKIKNPAPYAAKITSIVDKIKGMEVPVICPVTLPYMLPAGEMLTCTYTKTFMNGDPGLNEVWVETEGMVDGGYATAPFAFNTPTSEVNKEITVKDTNGKEWTTSDDASWTYEKEFACSTKDEDYTDLHYLKEYPNTATIVETKQSDSANVTLHCYQLMIDKTVETSFTREWKWKIMKDVLPEALWMFIGEKEKVGYTVEVVKDGFVDKGWMLKGEIEVYNPAPVAVEIVSVTDVITKMGESDIAATVDCGVTFPYWLAKESSLKCTYSADLPNGLDRWNKATAAMQNYHFKYDDTMVKLGQTMYWVKKAVTFGEPTTVLYGEVTVTDTNFADPLGEISDSTNWKYEKEFSCSTDKSLYTDGHYKYTWPNTAEIVETGQEDGALVTVHCYAPVVEKDAHTDYTRTFEWDIDKWASVESLKLKIGEVMPVEYFVKVWVTGYVDDDWMVHGSIWVTNPNPKEAMTVAVADVISPDIAATLECGGTLTVAPMTTGECKYHADLPDGSERLNTATVTLNQIPFYAEAKVSFGDPTELVDECVDVYDNDVFLGQVCVQDSPKIFAYFVNIGPYEECGWYEYANKAWLITIDRQIVDYDWWRIPIEVPCEGCTLTPGYWKTHSQLGPAPYDETWKLLDANHDGMFWEEQEPFFYSGQTWYEVFHTSPAGDPYYILAHAFQAAILNKLGGAYVPGEVMDALLWSHEFFATHKPGDKLTKTEKADLIKYADLLDQYNNGYIGPGHCSE